MHAPYTQVLAASTFALKTNPQGQAGMGEQVRPTTHHSTHHSTAPLYSTQPTNHLHGQQSKRQRPVRQRPSTQRRTTPSAVMRGA